MQPTDKPKKLRTTRNAPVAVALLCCVASFIASVWIMRRSGQPMHEGKTVTFWIEHFGYVVNAPTTKVVRLPNGAVRNLQIATGPTVNPSANALRAIGSNSIPYLVEALQRNDSVTRQLYARLWPKAPVAIRGKLPAPRPSAVDVRTRAISALSVLEVPAEVAFPLLIDNLKHSHSGLRAAAAMALSQRPRYWDYSKLESALRDLASNPARQTEFVQLLQALPRTPEFTVPVLAQALGNPDPAVRRQAAWHLERAMAVEAVPALVKALNDPDDEVRYVSIRALRVLGPEAASALPQLEQMLGDNSSMIRTAAKRAIEMIRPVEVLER